MPDVAVVDLPTEHGPARAHLHRPDGAPVAALVLGHGAGGGVAAPDLVAVTAEATGLGLAVVLVEQPYRVAGRRGSPRPPVLDGGWTQALGGLVDGPLAGLRLVVGGRSAGARVACRTATATGADGVLCLAFPVRPPRRPDAPSRLPELAGAGVPVLVVQGATDPYGRPDPVPGPPRRDVVVVPGDHSLRRTGPVRDAVGPWLTELLDLR